MMQPPRNAVPMALAAGLLLVIGIATYMRLTHQGFRDTADDSQAARIEPAAGAELDASPAKFRWPAQDGATDYVVVVRDMSGTLIWRSGSVASAEISPPPTLAIQVSKGRSYLWSVEVAGESGDHELGPWSFRLK